MQFSELDVNQSQTARTEALVNWLFGSPQVIGEINGSRIYGSRKLHWSARFVQLLLKSLVLPFKSWKILFAFGGILLFAPIW